MNSPYSRHWHTSAVTSASQSGEPSCIADDANIPNSEVLYRRLSRENPYQYTIDEKTGERRITSAAFKPKPDEDGLSVYRHSRLAKVGLDASAVATAPEHIVFGVSVGDIRSIKLGVRDDAWPQGVPEPGHPRNGAHALVVGWHGLTRGERARRARELTKLPSMKLAYQG